ncbi:acetyltransferase [Arthrobacter glacialis]|uniref:Acetyltransferase n=1 Tax=Arthrobacter glacialis TaxID=1664 RepID=A0A2S4A0A9_ARTGL|nr:acetyltransferase [Arthrobacter glacialis]
MPTTDNLEPAGHTIPVIDLSKAPGEHAAWDKPKIVIYMWAIAEILFVTNAWQISSGLRVRVLRLFGAKIGYGVIFRPRTRVKFPWKLHVGDRSWIGEGVWIHNQDFVHIGADVVVSQDTFITTGSHAYRKDMRLVTRPVRVEDGVWITAKCIVLGGTIIGTSTLIRPGTVVSGEIPANLVLDVANPAGSPVRFRK